MSEIDEREAAEPEAQTSDRWDDELIAGHEYDGIREYDNPIPGWLSLLFVGTIVWSLFYVVAINLGYISRYEETLEEGQQEIANMRRVAAADQEEVTPDVLASAVGKDDRLATGKTVFVENCAQCHAEDGGGKVGPNLTDDYWIHGGKLMDIYNIVTDGYKNLMPAWEGRLSQDERIAVTAYVRSLRGTEPEDPKEAEGEKFVPEE